MLRHDDRLTCLGIWITVKGDKEPRTGEKNEAGKSERARELLIFEFRP